MFWHGRGYALRSAGAQGGENGPRSRHVWAFSKFINEESLKIAFVQKVIHYIEQAERLCEEQCDPDETTL